MNSRLNKEIKSAAGKFTKSLNFEMQRSKKELLISRISNKLGKTKNEVESILTENLINLLAQVPFTKH